MGILDSLLGQYGGSLSNAAKQGGKQMGLLQMLGLGGAGPMAMNATQSGALPWNEANPGQQPGTSAPPWSEVPGQAAQNPNGGLSDLGRSLSTFGAGVSKASGPSATPISFGQVLAGGNDAMQAGQDRQLSRDKTQAEIGALGQKGIPDFDASAQQALIKLKAGIPLTPQEQATLQAWDTVNQAKVSSVMGPNGTISSAPAARSILPPGFGGQGQMAPQGGGQQIDPRRRLEQLEQQRRAAGVQ